MKKLVSLVLILSMAFCLAACGKKGTDTTYVQNMNGIEIKITLHAEGDIIKKMVQTTTVPLESLTEDQIKMLDDTIAQDKEKVDGIKGVKYDSDKTDKEITETFDMDLSNKDTLKELIASGLLPVDNKDADYLSLKATGKGLESSGYTVQK